MLGSELLLAIGVRDLAMRTSTIAEARDLRARAFTLLDQAYDECRRAVSFLRWHDGDAESFAPPLRHGRRARTAEPPAPVPPAPPAPTPKPPDNQ